MITLNLPALVTAEDYHAFAYMQEHFQWIITGGNIKVQELGVEGQAPKRYVGLAYTGRKPSSKTIEALLRARHITLDT